MYWEKYNITLEVGDRLHLCTDLNNNYVVFKIVGNIFGIRNDAPNFFDQRLMYSEFTDCVISDLKYFKPSKQLLRKHKLKNVLGKNMKIKQRLINTWIGETVCVTWPKGYSKESIPQLTEGKEYLIEDIIVNEIYNKYIIPLQFHITNDLGIKTKYHSKFFLEKNPESRKNKIKKILQ